MKCHTDGLCSHRGESDSGCVQMNFQWFPVEAVTNKSIRGHDCALRDPEVPTIMIHPTPGKEVPKFASTSAGIKSDKQSDRKGTTKYLSHHLKFKFEHEIRIVHVL